LLQEPEGIAADAKGDVWVSNTVGSNVIELSPTAEKIGKLGAAGTGNGQFKEPAGVAVSGEAAYVVDRGNSRVQEFKLISEKGEYTGEYVAQFGASGPGNGQFLSPQDLALDKQGNVWVADASNNRIQKFSPKGIGAHNTQTIYYTTAANSEYPGCGGHPEWANLACETKPASQPETSGLPEIPVMTYSAYNIWGEPEKSVETSGSTTRTTTATYDAGGRLLTSAISSTVDTALPTVTDEYNKETGALTTQSTTVEGKTKKLTSVYNSLAELVSYTDADENTATYSYDIDGRIEKTNDGKGTQTFTFDSITGFLMKLVDSMAGTFTASYDVQGDLLTEGYPNGMNATDTYNQLGQPTGLEYVKTTHCTSGCTWFSDTAIPSIHDQWLSQTSSLSSQSYAYDNAGRLTQVQDTPSGKGCTTRLYGYDEDTNRTSSTTGEPNSKGECVSEGGSVENHTYDSADRLTDTGTTYDAFGNTTSLSAVDAGGTALTSTYYIDDKLASQTQNGETIGYYPDPAGRTRETVATGKTSEDVISHYASASGTPVWTIEPASGHTTRNIPGINGALAAVQTNTETPVLQITDLHGDVVGTAALSETETKLLSTSDTTEYGVPRGGTTPPKYSWLGADALQTELPTGVIAMGARSYVPQLGRFLQTDPRPGGSADAYAYTFGDPVNTSDPSGEWTFATPGWLTQFDGEWAAGGEAREAARLAAARAEAERLARQAAEEAARSAAAQQVMEEQACEQTWIGCGGGGEPEQLGGSESWACEYAAETGQEAAGCDGGRSLISLGAAGHGDPPPRGGQSGSANEGGTGPCRSGGKQVHGKCQPGPGNVPNNCAAVFGAVGGAAGGAAGGYGALIGGALGGAIGNALCGNGKT
jgi:RHS repeat-associated protein